MHDPQALWQQWLAWEAGQPTVGKIDPETGGIGRLIETVKAQAPLPAQPQPTAMAWVQPRSGVLSPEVAAQFAPPAWQAPPPTAAPSTELPSFAPPPEGKPEWAQEPVPETWGEYSQWWLGRQAGHVAQWWEQAQEEIWGEPEEQLEPGEAITKQWAEAWEPGQEAAHRAVFEPSLEALGGTLLGAARGLFGGIIGAPIAGIKALRDVKEAPLVIKGLSTAFIALDRAARGVTGAIAGGFELFDTGLVEQGILGVGAEIVWPSFQGHEADFTPQEFEAGRNRYTRWWTSVSTYSKELWDARMKGVDWDTALDRASTKASMATEELRELTLEAIRNGATREDIESDATLTSPLAELAGRVILDPLNLLAKPGKAAHMRDQVSIASKGVNFEDATPLVQKLALMKAEGAANVTKGFKGLIYKTLHPNRADNATLAGRWAENSSLALSRMLTQADDPGEVSNIVLAMINLGDDDADIVRASKVFLKKFGRISESSYGKQATLLFREMATDPKTGKVSARIVGDWFKDATNDQQILKRIFKNYDGAVERIYPAGKLNVFRRRQNQYRKLLSEYMYMGWNPGYAMKNGASNTGLSMLAGWGPAEKADSINTYANRWGGDVFGLRKGFGGPGGEYLTEQLNTALDAIGTPFDAVRLKDLPDEVIKALAEKGVRAAPTMKLAEVMETGAGEKIIKQALEYVWKKHWRPKVPDDLATLFDRRALRAYEGILADCVNPVELENALGPALKGRIMPEGIDLRGLPTDLRDDIRHALLEAEGAEDFASRIGKLSDDVDAHLTKVLDESPTAVSKGDTLVMDSIKEDRKYIEQIEETELAQILHTARDKFEKGLSKTRDKELGNIAWLLKHTEKHPEDGAAITKLLGEHTINGRATKEIVDTARKKAWAMYEAIPSPRGLTKEADRIWNATTGGPFDDLGFFPYSDREWMKYWDELDEPTEAFFRRRPSPITPTAEPPPVPEAPPAAPVTEVTRPAPARRPRPLKRAFRAGPYTNEATFASPEQLDLYEMGAIQNGLEIGKYETATTISPQRARQNLQQLSEQLTSRLAIGKEEARRLGREVYSDVRSQMKGAKDESRALIDNVSIPTKPPAPPPVQVAEEIVDVTRVAEPPPIELPPVRPSDLDPPDFLTARNELAEEILADIVPPRTAIAHISNKQAKKILDDLANAAPGINWAAPEGLSPENYKRVMAWVKGELTPRMHEGKLIANKVALNERDYVLFNYGDRRHFDNALAYIFPYHYWYTRAATNVPRMLAYKPGMMSAYLDYKDAVHQINQEAQGLPWWEEQVKVPGTQFYLNLEATLNPLYSMINDFHNPDRTQTWQGEALENLGNLGPSVDVAFWALYAAWRAAEGKPEEALASMGYLGQPTKAFRYATGLLGAKSGKGITLEWWLWDDPFSFTGMDYYERDRMGYQFKQMEDEGAVTPEVIWDEGHKMAGPAWDEAVARQVQERAVPMLTSWLLGVGFKPRFPYEIQVQKALNAQYQFYAHADKTYDMDTEEGQAAYRAAQQQLYEYYPFLSYTMLVRRGEQDRDKAYAWEVLSRLPPGPNKYVILEAANTSEEALSKFYETSGDFTGWSEVDRAHFMASIQSLGNVLAIPDTARQKEWDSAQTLKRALNTDLQERFGEDIFDIQAVYYETRRICGADAAKAILDANPKLGEMWTARNAAIIASPALMSYWGSLDTLERVATNLLWDEMDKRWPNYTEVNTLYFKPFDKDEWKQKKAYRRDYLKANAWLKDAWDFKDKMKTALATEVEQLASEMIPPLGPITRDDTDLNSVLAERIMKVLGAKFTAGEMVETRAPVTEATPTIEAEPATEEAPPTAAAETELDVTDETVVQYEQPKRTAWERGAAAPRKAPTTAKFSWGYIKSQLGQSAFALIQHWNSRKPLSGELKGRLKEMYRSNPLGFGDFDSWLKFVKSLWRASVVSSRGGLRGVKGLMKKPRSFWSGQGRPGAGRKFLPWG